MTPLLIVMTGPVGAGKSTTSSALAQALRRTGLNVAVVDLDQLYGFVRPEEGYGDPKAWMWARHGAAALVTAFLAGGMSAVIVEGEFFNAQELDALVSGLSPTFKRRFFTLQLSYAATLERVQKDPSRGASKDPAFLRSLHMSYEQALPFLHAMSTVFDTEGLTQDEVVTQLLGLI